MGLETERLLPGNLRKQTERDAIGRVTGQNILRNYTEVEKKSYLWGANDRLLSVVTNGKTKHFEYDGRGYPTQTFFEDGSSEIRIPDKTGNLYERLNRSDRKYGAGGRLVKTENWEYKYDDSGNLIRKKDRHGATWRYEWNGAGMLSKVKRPDAVEVTFKYDALGRRIEKSVNDRILTKWVWDGNVPLHEWREIHRPDYEVDRGHFTDIEKQPLTTWLFEEGTFVPAAKLTKTEKLSIVTNYMGTPEAMYREDGEAVWTCELNSYGKVRNFQGGSKTDCPFRYQGQYEDAETGLYYNRFRYYSPEEGVYISQDIIGLKGGINLYNYVQNTNNFVDLFGLLPVGTQTPSMATPVSSKPTSIELQQRAYDLQSILPESSQGYKTSAVGYAIDTQGHGYMIAASSDMHLSPTQRGSLDLSSGEIRASGSGHAEMTVMNYCRNNNLTLVSIAASRPVCGNCQTTLDQNGVEIVSERKKVTLCDK